MSDDEDSDFDPDEIMRELEGMKKLLQRHVGKYKVTPFLLECTIAIYLEGLRFDNCGAYSGACWSYSQRT